MGQAQVRYEESFALPVEPERPFDLASAEMPHSGGSSPARALQLDLAARLGAGPAAGSLASPDKLPAPARIATIVALSLAAWLPAALIAWAFLPIR